MDDIQLNPVDYDDLKRRISEEIGKVSHELAAKKGMSFDEFREYFFAKSERQSRLKTKRKARAQKSKRRGKAH